MQAMPSSLGDRLGRWTSFFAFTMEGLLQPELAALGKDVLAFHRQFFAAPGGRSALAQTLNFNFASYLPDDLLVKMDRTSMAHALETRSPFLDTALIEYVSGLPDHYKLRGRTTKYILRRAFADLMPPVIRGRGKMGFGVPLATWFRGDLRRYLLDHIASPSSRINDYVRPQAISEMVQDHMNQNANHEHQLWALLTLELWLRSLPRLSRPWEEGAMPAPRLQAGVA
jgi:asparagine synthase (glutamine-hydrolysing)